MISFLIIPNLILKIINYCLGASLLTVVQLVELFYLIGSEQISKAIKNYKASRKIQIEDKSKNQIL
jgi:hypothetical protein